MVPLKIPLLMCILIHNKTVIFLMPRFGKGRGRGSYRVVVRRTYRKPAYRRKSYKTFGYKKKGIYRANRFLKRNRANFYSAYKKITKARKFK